MYINKDTLVFGSFSKRAGNVGCEFFNKMFNQYNINAIYKSFSIDNIENAVKAAKYLSFSGFAVSMPYKKEIIKYLDESDDIVKHTNTCNTVILKNNKLYGFNTDYLAVKKYLENIQNPINNIYILGNGGYSTSVQVCCKDLNIKYTVIDRSKWSTIEDIKNSYIFNCTPVEDIYIDNSNIYINCINTTSTGKELALLQAKLQFALYTSINIE
jgi:shikimate dehydrogenase